MKKEEKFVVGLLTTILAMIFFVSSLFSVLNEENLMAIICAVCMLIFVIVSCVILIPIFKQEQEQEQEEENKRRRK